MTNNDKRQTMTKDKQRQWMTNDKQQQVTNNDQRQTKNNKHNYFLNAYHESWPPRYLDHLDYSDQLNHSDNPDWSMINQKDNRRIRIVYLVLFFQQLSMVTQSLIQKSHIRINMCCVHIMHVLIMHFIDNTTIYSLNSLNWGGQPWWLIDFGMPWPKDSHWRRQL